MNTEVLVSRYKKARDCNSIVTASGYKQLKTEKLEFLQRKEREKTLNGLKPNYQLDEELLEGRTYLRLFEEWENWAKNLEKFKSALKKSNITV